MVLPLDTPTDADDPLADLHPLVDPFRCSPCLERGDSCAFHAGLAMGLDHGPALFLLPTDIEDIA